MRFLAVSTCTLVLACQQAEAPAALAASAAPIAPTQVSAPAVPAALEVAITYCIP